MSGTIPLSLSQQLDQYGKPLIGGKLYIIQAGTTATPQNPYQDSALTIPLANPIILDSAGRIPQFFLADGTIKIRLTDVNGVTQETIDGILVTGASSGTGTPASVDATTILATGDFKARYGTGVLSGFVRANARTIGSATSGGTERANSDCQALFEYLWGADTNLSVSTGRGVSANADWVANKALTLPDLRGRGISALDDMGNTAAGRLGSSYFGATATTLGATGGGESSTLLTANLPAYTPAGTNASISVQAAGSAKAFPVAPTKANISFQAVQGGGAGVVPTSTSGSWAAEDTMTGAAPSFTGTAQGGTSTPVRTVPPTMLATIYIKL